MARANIFVTCLDLDLEKEERSCGALLLRRVTPGILVNQEELDHVKL